VQNDGNDWEVDEDNKPERILHHKLFTKHGLPEPTVDEIPAEKVAGNIDHLAIKMAEASQ
jgi:hypothetical protein